MTNPTAHKIDELLNINRKDFDWQENILDGLTRSLLAQELFARAEGILPAPESSHAIRVAIDEAMKCKETGEEKTIVFGLTGTGYFDMVAYEKFHNGEMNDYIPTDEELQKSIGAMPIVE